MREGQGTPPLRAGVSLAPLALSPSLPRALHPAGVRDCARAAAAWKQVSTLVERLISRTAHAVPEAGKPHFWLECIVPGLVKLGFWVEPIVPWGVKGSFWVEPIVPADGYGAVL